MSLSPRAIALQGIGLGVLLTALQGFGPASVQQELPEYRASYTAGQSQRWVNVSKKLTGVQHRVRYGKLVAQATSKAQPKRAVIQKVSSSAKLGSQSFGSQTSFVSHSLSVAPILTARALNVGQSSYKGSGTVDVTDEALISLLLSMF